MSRTGTIAQIATVSVVTMTTAEGQIVAYSRVGGAKSYQTLVYKIRTWRHAHRGKKMERLERMKSRKIPILVALRFGI